MDRRTEKKNTRAPASDAAMSAQAGAIASASASASASAESQVHWIERYRGREWADVYRYVHPEERDGVAITDGRPPN